MIKIKHQDWIEFLRDTDQMFDFICVDPPYGKVNGMKLTGQDEAIDWDVAPDWKLMFELFNKKLKDGGTIAVFGQNPTYAEMLLSNKEQYKYEYIWLKNNCAQGFHADIMPLVYTENIAIFIKDNVDRVFNKISNKEIDKEKYPIRWYSQQLQKWIIEKYDLKSRKDIYRNLPRLIKNDKEILDRRLEFFFFFNGTLFTTPSELSYNLLIKHFKIDKWDNFIKHKDLIIERKFNIEQVDEASLLSNTIKNVLSFSKDSEHLHPTQKPLKLMEHLIKTYTNENDYVLDCFIGSGTTALASKKLNRNFYGCDNNKEYVRISEKRLSHEILMKELPQAVSELKQFLKAFDAYNNEPVKKLKDEE